MDLRALGALLTALGGVFSAKAGAKAGQLQGFLLGEDITERRKRMKMAEEAQQLQMQLLKAEEERKSQLFPMQMQLLQQDLTRRQELFPLEKEALATKVEADKLNLLNQRLWSLFQQGVAPSQISDPVLRRQYEPFFNYISAVKSLEAVQSEEDLRAVLGRVGEEQRTTLELLGRAQLFANQTKRQMLERQLQGLDLNIAQGEFQLRTTKLNYALNTILSNIDREGMAWDKRSPQQKVEAVKKWVAQLGLEDVVPEDFANIFQRVKSTDARQLALLQAQINLQTQAQSRLLQQQYGYNLNLQREAAMTNLVYGALQGGGQGGVAPVGFMKPAPPPNIFKPTPDNQGSYLNQSALNKYLEPPIDVAVPFGNGTVLLSSLRGRVASIYNKLGRPNATISAEEINTLITYDAGLQLASARQAGFSLGWDTALLMAKENIIPVLKGNHLYRSNNKYKQIVDEWERVFARRLQQPQQTQSSSPQMPTGQIGQPPANAEPRGRGVNYTSSARRRRE